MIQSSIQKNNNIKIANYFDDLKILIANHKHFPCEIIHRKTEHRNYSYSLEMISDGEVYLYLDNKKKHLKGPCVFWIGNHTKHFQYELIEGISYDHYWIDFTGERGRKIYETLYHAFPDSFISLKSEKKMKVFFEEFTQKFQVARRPASSPDDVIKIELMMYELFRESETTEFDIDDPFGIKKLAQEISNSPFEEYNLQQLAQQKKISYVYFRKLFKKYTGKSVGQYILEQQMITAGELLKSRQFRVGELADYCGFKDIASFSRAFKRYYKVPPKHWDNFLK